MTSIVKAKETPIAQQAREVHELQQLAQQLMQTKHYQKLGTDGVFAIVAKARSLGIDPLDALNGGLYYVDGHVEMSAQMMNQLIRMTGHSISKDPKSNDEICILHGRRGDNGDTWTCQFSMADANRAGISHKQNWKRYPQSMLFARCLSLLGRQLFPDIIKNCYVQGEIEVAGSTPLAAEPIVAGGLNEEQVKWLTEMIENDEEYRTQLLDFFSCDTLLDLPQNEWERIAKSVEERWEVRNNPPETIEVTTEAEEE